MDTVHQSRPIQVIKMKKPEQIIMEVRSKKIAEMNQYKNVAGAEQKYEEI